MAQPLGIFVSHPSEFLTDHRPHGDGLLAWEFIRRLAERGHQLHVAVPAMDLRADPPPNVTLYPMVPRGPWSTLQPLEYMVRVRAAFRRVRHQHTIHLVHQLNPVNDALSCLIARDEIPLVLGPYVAAWPRDGEPLRVRSSLLGRVGLRAAGPLIAHYDREQERLARALLLSTPAALGVVHDPDAVRDRTHLLPYGVDTECFFPDDPPSGAESTVLFLANLHRRKGIFTLLDAWDRVAAAVPAARLRVVGSGSESEAVRERVAGRGQGSRVELRPGVARAQVAAEMRACTVYCLPSFGEPFGATALEAMSCGQPVVATNAGGLAYLIDKRGGRKVPVDDPAALAAVLIEILTTPGLAAAMGKHNRRRAEEEFAWDRVIGRLEGIYAGVLTGSGLGTATR